MDKLYKQLITLLSIQLLSMNSNISANCQASYGANYFKFGKHMIPHPEKIMERGEDTYFLNENLLVIADGIGGWVSNYIYK